MELSVLFAGTAGSAPSARRGLPALLIATAASGSSSTAGGTQRQLIRSVGLVELTDVFITHLHLDHWLGLPGLLKSLDLRDRTRPLQVHGPPGIREALASMRGVVGRLRFPLEVVELAPEDAVRRGELEIQPVNVRHRTLAYGYVFIEDDRRAL